MYKNCSEYVIFHPGSILENRAFAERLIYIVDRKIGKIRIGFLSSKVTVLHSRAIFVSLSENGQQNIVTGSQFQRGS